MATKKTVKKKVQYLGTGRRKTAIARVRLIPGEGNITINKRTFEDYFPLDTMRLIVNQPLEAVSATDKFDVIVNVHGGGMTGQAGAIRHGIARALCVCDKEAYRATLKKQATSNATPDRRNARSTVCTRRARHLSSPRDNFAIRRTTLSAPLSRMLTYINVRSASRFTLDNKSAAIQWRRIYFNARRLSPRTGKHRAHRFMGG